MSMLVFVIALILFVVILALAVIITIFVQRAKARAAQYDAQEKFLQLESDIKVERNNGNTAQEKIRALESELSASQEKIHALESELREYQEYKALALEREQQLARQTSEYKEQLSKLSVENKEANVTIQNYSAENATLRTRIEEQIKLIDEQQSKLQKEFELHAQKILEANTQKLKEENQESLKVVLDPLTRTMTEFKKRIEETHTEDTKQRTSLEEKIKSLNEMNLRISLDAQNLTKALKGDVKKQGNWGEMILARVLEATGLRAGEEYVLQEAHADSDSAGHKRNLPDAIVHLPDNRDIIIDAKMSLVAYDRYVASETKEEQNAATSDLVTSIKAHINGLSEKNYDSIKDIRSIDMVLMFIPNEGIYSVAMVADQSLFDYAMKKKILLVSPTNLLATLKAIEYGWRSEKQSKNVQTIVDEASKLYDKVADFALNFLGIGDRINKLHEEYEKTEKQLKSGSGNIIGRIEKIRKLGAKPNKQLPPSLQDDDEDSGFVLANTDV